MRALAFFLPLAGLAVLGLVLARPRTTVEDAARIEHEYEERVDSARLRPFDPNRADYEELRSLGLSKYEAVSLLKYRASGKIFRIPA